MSFKERRFVEFVIALLDGKELPIVDLAMRYQLPRTKRVMTISMFLNTVGFEFNDV